MHQSNNIHLIYIPNIYVKKLESNLNRSNINYLRASRPGLEVLELKDNLKLLKNDYCSYKKKYGTLFSIEEVFLGLFVFNPCQMKH